MATKKSSSSRSSSAKKAAETKAAKQADERRKRELRGVILIAAGILAGIYIFIAGSGVLGTFLRNFFFGLLGWFAYGVPFVLIGMGVVCIMGSKGTTKGGLFWVLVGVVDILVLSHTASNPEYKAMQYTKYIGNAYTAGGNLKGGGVIGAILCYPLEQLGGNALCYVLTITVLLIVILMLTRLSIRDIGATVEHKVQSAVESAREYVSTTTDLIREDREERKQKKMQIFTAEAPDKEESEIEKTPHLQTAGDAEEELSASVSSKKKKPAEEPYEDEEEEEQPARRRRGSDGDLSAFNAFAATLPVSDSPRKVKDEPARTGGTPQKELTYISDTDLRARPQRTIAPKEEAEAEAQKKAVRAIIDEPKAEGSKIWEDLEPSDTAYTAPVKRTPAASTTSSRAAAPSTGAAAVAGVAVTSATLGAASAAHGDIRATGRMTEEEIESLAGAMFTSVSGNAAGRRAAASAHTVRVTEPIKTTPAFTSVAPSAAANPPAAVPAEDQVKVPDIPEDPSDGEEDMTPEEALASLRGKPAAGSASKASSAAAETAEAAPVSAVRSTAAAQSNTASSVGEAVSGMRGNPFASATIAPASPAVKTAPAAQAESGEQEEEKPLEEGHIEITEPIEPKPYCPPPLELLNPPTSRYGVGNEDPEKTGQLLIDTLESFGISATLTDYSVGPVITRFELQPAKGVRVNRITALSNDIALALAASRVRIEAPIPGKAAVGIEIPNKHAVTVVLRDIIESKQFQDAPSPITLALGKDTGGQVLTADLAKMPHLLIAGSTGSGKSVCINDLLISMVYKTSPADLRLILIDPKVVELSVFSALPHLLVPVVTDPKHASGALHWAVNEMTLRYKKFSEIGSRDLARYNALQDDPKKRLPKLVVVVDELADLMMVAPDEVEDSICRIAQLGRAAGIHLIVATQRPSADIITGLIKANIPSRCAFAVSSGVDSRIILDETGAEKLLGRGDMLFHANGSGKPVRAQAAFVSDEEVEHIMDYFRGQNQEPKFDENIVSDLTNAGKDGGASGAHGEGKQEDELLGEAVRIVMESGQASISMIQRRLRVGYARAARLVDMMEQEGYVSGFEGSKPRRVLIKRAEFERIFGNGSYEDEGSTAEPATEDEEV